MAHHQNIEIIINKKNKINPKVISYGGIGIIGSNEEPNGDQTFL